MRKQHRQNFTLGSGFSHSVRCIRSASLKFYLILILAGALMLSSLPLAVEAEALRTVGDEVAATTENDGDLSTTKFDTLEGTVVVNLPGDTTAGDEISGTVVEEPKGKTPEEKAANQDTLEGYVVEVANKPTKENDSGQWSIPAKAESIDVVLKKKTGEVVSKAKVTVRGWDPQSAAAGKGGVTTVVQQVEGGRPYQVPPVGQAGKPVRIDGQFNGNFTTTAVKIGGTGASPIAESPRSSIVKIPTGATGPTTIDIIKDGKPVASCPFTVLGIKLAAGNLQLKRGETSWMKVDVLGVRKLASPAQVKVDNRFPGTMRLEGGDSQTLTVPANLDTDTFSATRTLTGIQVGAFAITAVVKPPPCAAGGCAACNSEAKTAGPTQRLNSQPSANVTIPLSSSRTAAPMPDPTPAPTPNDQGTLIKSKSNITNNRIAAPTPDPTPAPTPNDQGTLIKSKSNITNNRTAAPTPDPTPLPNTVAAENGRIQGLTVQITGADGSIIATQVTDKEGNVDFGVLPEGAYGLTIIANRAPAASTSRYHEWRWTNARMDKKTERIEMKSDSTGRYGGAQFATGGMTTFRADGKSRVKWNFSKPADG